MEKKKFTPATLCVQGGWQPTKGEPRVLPIYQSTTFKYDTSEQMARLFDLEDSGYFYTRLQNPTNDAVAAKIAALEGGVGAMLTSSGQAANFYAIFNICQAGDHFVCASTIYGGTFNLFAVTMKKLGIECTFVDINASEEELQKAFQPNTKALFGETIANPALTWETTDAVNLGINFEAFRSRLSIEADLYWSRTSDLLLTVKQSQVIGYDKYLDNFGNTENYGVEVTISSDNIRRRNFVW